MSRLPDMPDADSLDLLLRQAMTARPDEYADIDVAAAALSRVRTRDAQAAALARLGRWIGISVVAAALLVAVSVSYILHAMPANESSSQTQTTVQSADGTTTSTDSQTTILAILGTAAVGLALAGVMSTDRRTPRLVPV